MTIRVWLWLLLALSLVTVVACTRREEPNPSPAATSVATTTGAAGAAPAAPAAPSATNTQADEDEGEDAIGPDFEIQADASTYTWWIPATVEFTVKALNGTPPYSFTWDFGDGSPTETGEVVTHTLTKLGLNWVMVRAREAGGEEANFQLGIMLFTLEEYAAYRGIDPALLRATPAPAAEASPATGESPAPSATR